MAKLTLTDIASGFQSNTAANANNALIEAALENTLSRDGTSPNTMLANLDMNSHAILNASGLTINGVTVVPTGTTTFPASGMAFTPTGNIVATTVQTAIEELDNEKSSLTTLASSSGSSLIGFIQSGTGSVLRNVQDKSRDSINVRDFGAIGSGDETIKIQAAIDATPVGGTLYFDDLNYTISTRLTVSKFITLQGNGPYITTITCTGCSGIYFNTVNGYSQVKHLKLAAAVRYTTTPNSYIAIEFAGATGARPEYNVLRDVYCDGFGTAFKAAWLWATVFDNFRCNNGHVGIHATHEGMNNTVRACSLLTDGSTGSRGILLDSVGAAPEGWMISDTLIDNSEIGIQGIGITHVFITNCIIDHNRINAILIQDDGTNFGGNWTIRGNYIAMLNASGDCAIGCTNTIVNTQNRGNIITNNQVLVYAGSTCLRGIYMSGAQTINNIISGNTLKGFSTTDITCSVGPNIVIDNNCQSTVTYNLNVVGSSVLKNNIGITFFQEFTQYETLGQNKVTWSYTIPTTGTWTQGDICWKSNVAAAGSPGWVCTTGGTPGTWKTMANIAA